MKIVRDNISLKDVKQMANHMFGDLVKAVVDIKKGIMAVDAELHADEEKLLLEQGSRQNDLWGINVYPDLPKEQMIEFDSMINVRPSQNNRSRGVDDPLIRKKIEILVNKLITND
jgi:hypothetical protein